MSASSSGSVTGAPARSQAPRRPRAAWPAARVLGELLGVSVRDRRPACAPAACPAAPRARLARRRAARHVSGLSGPTYTPSTDAIGAMSHAPRHSNARTMNAGSSPAASRIASYSASAPRSEHEMFVHTYTAWRSPTGRCGGSVSACHRTWRPPRARPGSRASRTPPARAPAASTSRTAPGRRAARGSRPSGGRGTAPCSLRSARAARAGRRSWPVGDRRALLLEVRVRVPAVPLTGRCLRGSDRASPGWRSCPRCRRPSAMCAKRLQLDERRVAHVHARGL